jgi:O-antigen chain-terminating methyltransferase
MVGAEVTILRREIERLREQLDDLRFDTIPEQLVTLRADLDASASRLDEHEAARIIDEARDIKIQELELARTTIDRQLRTLASDIGRLSDGPIAPSDELTELVQANERDTQALYERFEDEFRPSDDGLTSGFAEYLPDLSHLAGGDRRLVDIGCGRGDWLVLLGEHNIPAIGVDTNADSVDQALARGVEALVGDGIAYLRNLERESIGAVSAFHVVEHLPASAVVELIDAALRALQPGGVLIFETPNPSNLTVGASAFWRDPTHLRPVESSYLAFVVQDRGFVSVEIRFLHPTPQYDFEVKVLQSDERPAIGRLLDDVSWALHGPQDYAVVARRPPIVA